MPPRNAPKSSRAKRAIDKAPTAPVPAPSGGNKRTILLAVTGTSPAILTESVWALSRETTAIIPDRVVVVTTTSGFRTLDEQLLARPKSQRGLSVWQDLRRCILGSGFASDPRLTLETPLIVSCADPATGASRQLDDIRTQDDNTAAAETLLTAVRRFSTDPEIMLIGLLSGGRKTMGALLHAALSLAGRPGDRLVHVLVTEPFDNPRLVPPFYFPGQAGSREHRLPGADGKVLLRDTARIELADVPLVALGELIFNRTGHAPATFASFARIAQTTLAEAALDACQIKVSYSSALLQATVNQYVVTLPEGRSSAFFRQLVIDAANDEDLADRRLLEERWRCRGIKYRKSDGSESTFTDDDLSNAQNTVRTDLLEVAKVPEPLVNRLFPRRASIGLNREGVSVRLVD